MGDYGCLVGSSKFDEVDGAVFMACCDAEAAERRPEEAETSVR